MGNCIVMSPGKEFIVKRKARKNAVCHECGKPIFIGDEYIEDHINYVVASRSYGKPFLKWYTNKSCMKSWKGPVP